MTELHAFCTDLVEAINTKYGDGEYKPVTHILQQRLRVVCIVLDFF